MPQVSDPELDSSTINRSDTRCQSSAKRISGFAVVGVHQHHDGLTGTDLEYVALNYANMIANATAALNPVSAAAAAQVAGLGIQAASTAIGCPERNVSICPATAKALNEPTGQIETVLFNPLARSRKEVVAIPVRAYSHRIRSPCRRCCCLPWLLCSFRFLMTMLGSGACCKRRSCGVFEQRYQRTSAERIVVICGI